MKILITGGAGFIGSNFVRMIADGRLSGYSSITVLDKLTYAGVLSNLDSVQNFPGFKFVQGDICDREIVRTLIHDIDCIVNFAAESHVDRSIKNSELFVRTNILGVQILLDVIKESNRKIRLIQVSTDEVYGSIETGSWNETCPVEPNSPYAASKASGELLALSYQRTHGIDVIVTRCSNNYGTHHFPEKLIPLFITNLIEGKKLPLYGNGKNIRDWLHVDDHCRAIDLVLSKGLSGNIYNIGGGLELSNFDITKMLLFAMGRDESCIEYVGDRLGHDFRYSVDWSKIHDELGYSPKIKFEFGLKETIKWYVQNESWWKPLKARL
jgi:dTDP-glucose 4,6-dehydratase